MARRGGIVVVSSGAGRICLGLGGVRFSESKDRKRRCASWSIGRCVLVASV